MVVAIFKICRRNKRDRKKKKRKLYYEKIQAFIFIFSIPFRIIFHKYKRIRGKWLSLNYVFDYGEKSTNFPGKECDFVKGAPVSGSYWILKLLEKSERT